MSLSDGISTVTDSKTVTVPPEGTRVFFCDGVGGAAPYELRATSKSGCCTVPGP